MLNNIMRIDCNSNQFGFRWFGLVFISNKFGSNVFDNKDMSYCWDLNSEGGEASQFGLLNDFNLFHGV